GIDIEEKVAIVHVETADVHTLRIEGQLSLKKFVIIDIALLDTKDRAELLIGVDVISCPGDVAEIIFRAFVELEMNIDGLIVVLIDRVGQYFRVAIPL